jgi:formiminoglutamate deiminase
VTTFWCQQAWLGEGPVEAVRISIEQGRIAAVTAGATRHGDDEVLPGLVFPGFANAHSHAFHRALRGRTQSGHGGSFWTWREQMYGVADRLGPDSYYQLAKACYAEMLLAGICAVAEFHYVHHQPGGRPYPNPNAMNDAVRAAAADAGIRLTLLDTLYLTSGPSALPGPGLNHTQQRFSDQSVRAFLDRHLRLDADANTVVGVAVHSVRAVSPTDIATVVGTVTDAPLHVHLSEQLAENEACQSAYGKSPSQVLADAGALSPRTVAVHATLVSCNDVSLLGQSGTQTCLCPTTERDLADGIGPGLALHRSGSPISLGTDSQAVIDLFEEARGVEMHERLRTSDRGHFMPVELVEMLSVNGYAALGWHSGGSITPGGLGDLVAVSTNSVRTAGACAEELVFAATSADVSDVVVAGVRRVRNGQHALGDVGAALASATRALDPPSDRPASEHHG